MNNREALQALLGGKKLTRTGWGKAYVVLQNNLLMDENNEITNIVFPGDKEWFTYSDPIQDSYDKGHKEGFQEGYAEGYVSRFAYSYSGDPNMGRSNFLGSFRL